MKKKALLLTLLIPWIHGQSADAARQADIPKLLDTATRTAEAARLAECDGKERTLAGFRFHRAPQPDQSGDLWVLAAAYDFEFASRRGPDRAYTIEKPDELFGPHPLAADSLEPALSPIRESALYVFGPDGAELHPFGGHNYIDRGFLFDMNRDGILDCASVTHHSVEGADKHTITVFELKSVERTPRSLLRVIYNWHPYRADRANTWTFDCLDEDGDGLAEIVFGPEKRPPGQPERRFVFRWNSETGRYFAGEIPERSHIRVLEPDESLKQIAGEGGLGYPLESAAPDRHERSAPVPSVPETTRYVYTSLKEASDAGILAFFRGSPHHYPTIDLGDATTSRLPDGFWDLEPKRAALAFADANRTPAHRQRWQLAIDDRDGIAPPKSGWLLYQFTSSGCYSLTRQVFALRFGAPQPSLLVTDFNTNGVVGANPRVDQPGYGARAIALSDQEARFLAETVFWLDRIRSRALWKVDGSSMSFSTADGWGSLHLFSDEAAPRVITSACISAIHPLGGRWPDDAYSPETCLNFTDHLLAHALPAHLGQRWHIAPDVDRHSLATPLAERLRPRLDADARKQLVATLSDVFAFNRDNPIPAQALTPLVLCAGEEAMTELRPALEELNASVPSPDSAETEFEALAKRFPVRDDPKDHPEDFARYQALMRQRESEQGPILLRAPLASTLARLSIAEDADRLMQAARTEGPLARWALNCLRTTFPDRWEALLLERYRGATPEERRRTLYTMAADPPVAKRFIATLPLAQQTELSVEIAEFRIRHDPDSARHSAPDLMRLVRERTADGIRRGKAICLLGEIPLEPATTAALKPLLLAEIMHPPKDPFSWGYAASQALDTFSRLPGAAGHADQIAASARIGYDCFHSCLDALLHLSRGEPQDIARLETFIRRCLKQQDGMMNEVFLACLALDLRGLAPEIAAMASASPSVPDGDGADSANAKFKGAAGHRYHLAREITALWNEEDPSTLARLWLALIVSSPHQFLDGHRPNTPRHALRRRAAAALRHLPAQSAATRNSMIASIPPHPGYAELVAWLREAANPPPADLLPR